MDDDPDNAGPLYHEGGPYKKLFLRGWFLITFLAVLVAFILGLVKAKDDAVMYLLVVNLLISGIIGTTIAWWFHKGHVKSQSLVFILFVGMCIVFQAIVSDIYLYHKPTTDESNIVPVKGNTTSTIAPSTVKLFVSMSRGN